MTANTIVWAPEVRLGPVVVGSPLGGRDADLALEEREHVDLLTTEYDRWKAGKPGLL